MALLNTVKRLAQSFGNEVTLRRITYTPDSTKPWETTQSQVDLPIRTINPEYLLEVDKSISADLYVAGDIPVTVNDIFIINSQNYIVDAVNEINFEGVVVVKTITFR